MERVTVGRKLGAWPLHDERWLTWWHTCRERFFVFYFRANRRSREVKSAKCVEVGFVVVGDSRDATAREWYRNRQCGRPMSTVKYFQDRKPLLSRSGGLYSDLIDRVV